MEPISENDQNRQGGSGLADNVIDNEADNVDDNGANNVADNVNDLDDDAFFDRIANEAREKQHRKV